MVFSVIYRANLPVIGGVLMLHTYFLFLLCAAIALFPNILWAFEKLGLRWNYSNTNDVSPSIFYKFGRKITIYAFFIISVVFLVWAITELINPTPIMRFDPVSRVWEQVN